MQVTHARIMGVIELGVTFILGMPFVNFYAASIGPLPIGKLRAMKSLYFIRCLFFLKKVISVLSSFFLFADKLQRFIKPFIDRRIAAGAVKSRLNFTLQSHTFFLR